MERMLNTLFVTTAGAYLRRQRDTVEVLLDRKVRLQVPVSTLAGIVCIGRVSCSNGLMVLCAENGLQLSFLSTWGRFLARVTGKVSGNVLLRKKQYRTSDNPDASALIARAFVAGKLANCRNVIMRAARESDDKDNELVRRAELLSQLLQRLEKQAELETLRGIEGDAAAIYFGVFGNLITDKESFPFNGRSRRPPLDRVNALLSFLYTLLLHDCIGALEAVGLDPAVGFLHRDRPGRPSLALDLMEEFRPMLADRLVMSLINRQQVKPSGFDFVESGAVLMNDKTRKEVIAAYQKRKQDRIRHPFLGKQVQVGLLPIVQALLLARYLRSDLDVYPPFVWR